MENRTVISSRGYFIIRRVSRGKREKGRKREETEKRNPCEIISPRAFEQFHPEIRNFRVSPFAPTDVIFIRMFITAPELGKVAAESIA